MRELAQSQNQPCVHWHKTENVKAAIPEAWPNCLKWFQTSCNDQLEIFSHQHMPQCHTHTQNTCAWQNPMTVQQQGQQLTLEMHACSHSKNSLTIIQTRSKNRLVLHALRGHQQIALANSMQVRYSNTKQTPAHAACSQLTPTKCTSKLANATCPSTTLTNCIQYKPIVQKDSCAPHTSTATKIEAK